MPVGLINLGLLSLGPWMAPFTLLLDTYVADMLLTCSQDPPPMPDFSNFNPVDLVGGVLNPAFIPARDKLLHAFQNWFWHRYCFCATGSLTQPAPGVVAPPLGTSASSGSLALPCATGGWTGMPPVHGTGPPIAAFQDVTQQVLPVGPGRLAISDLGGPMTLYEVPKGLSSVVGSGFNEGNRISIFGNQTGLQGWGFNAQGVIILGWSFNTSDNQPNFSVTVPIDPAWVYWWFGVITIDEPLILPLPTLPVRLSTQTWCGGSSPASLESCCPPDQTTSNMLQAILNTVTQLQSGGALPPGSYVDSVLHQGLTGLGTIALQKNTVAVRAVIRQDNNQLPVGVGDPPYLFNRGFLVPNTGRGWARGNVRLTYNPQTYILPQFSEQIGYTLADGLIVDITEMIPGP